MARKCAMSTIPTAIVKTIATTGAGITELVAAIDRHREHLVASGELERRRRARARFELEAALQASLRAEAVDRAGGVAVLDEAAARIAARSSDPLSEATQLLMPFGQALP